VSNQVKKTSKQGSEQGSKQASRQAGKQAKEASQESNLRKQQATSKEIKRGERHKKQGKASKQEAGK